MRDKVFAIGIVLILAVASVVAVQAQPMNKLIPENTTGLKYGHKIVGRYMVHPNNTTNKFIKEGKMIRKELKNGKRIAEERYREAVKEFRKAKEMYRMGNRSKKMEMFQRGKHLMYKWSDMCERWIERLMERVKASHMNEQVKLQIMERLENALNKVKNFKTNINETHNVTQLRMTVREMRDMWRNVRTELRYSVYEYIVWKFSDILEKATQLSDRFAALGMNVSSINAKITQINTTINQAKMMLNSNDLRGAAEKIMEARKELRELFKELRMYAVQYTYKLRHTGGLVYAKVNGSFKLSGNYTAFIRGFGNVTVTPTTAIVTKVVHENYVRILVKGVANVTGTGNFRVVAHGTGEIALNGTGFYRVKPSPTKPLSAEIPINGTVTVRFG